MWQWWGKVLICNTTTLSHPSFNPCVAHPPPGPSTVVTSFHLFNESNKYLKNEPRTQSSIYFIVARQWRLSHKVYKHTWAEGVGDNAHCPAWSCIVRVIY